MKLDIIEALSDGLDRTLEKNGLMLAGLYFITGLITASSSQTVINSLGISAQTASGAPTLALPIPAVAAGLIAVIGWLGSVLLSIVTIRTMVSSEKETIKPEFYSREIPQTVLNMIAGGLTYSLLVALTALVFLMPAYLILNLILGISGIATGGALYRILILIGSLPFTIPAIFLVVTFYFWNIFVASESYNFIEALKNSWDLTKGHRLHLFGLLVAVTISTGIFGGLIGLPSRIGYPVAGSILSQMAGGLTTVFAISTTAQAYNQLKTDDSGDPSFV